MTEQRREVPIAVGANVEVDSRTLLADLLNEAVQIDGDHHKQYYLEAIADAFGIKLIDHEEGIAP